MAQAQESKSSNQKPIVMYVTLDDGPLREVKTLMMQVRTDKDQGELHVFDVQLPCYISSSHEHLFPAL